MLASDVDVRLISTYTPGADNIEWLRQRPSLVFCWSQLEFMPPRGFVLASQEIGKNTEYERLAKAGIPVPLAFPLSLELDSRSDLFGEYVIVKPVEGYLGRGVRLVKVQDIRARFPELTEDGSRPMLAQKFIDCETEDGRPIEYRVQMALGEPFCMMRRAWLQPRPPLETIARNPNGLIATSTPKIAGPWSAWADREILELAKAAAVPFARNPCLGIDLVRERTTGKLYVLEVDSRGFDVTQVPHRGATPDERAPFYNQFDGLTGIAERLIARTRELAI